MTTTTARVPARAALAALRRWLAAPRVPDPPARWWGDRPLAAAVVAGSGLEVLLDGTVAWPLEAWAVNLVVAAALLQRRSRPLSATVLGFGVLGADAWARGVTATPALETVSTTLVLALPYALARWGSGRDALLGAPVMALVAGSAVAFSWSSWGETLGGFVVLFGTMEAGYLVRSRAEAQERLVADAKSSERVELARELHDTIAHHVSSIAVQAQAGRAMAARDPAAPVAALAVIEQEASRTLAEMRTLVRVLRTDEEPRYAPTATAGDVAGLAREDGGAPAVRVSVEGELDDVEPAVGAAAYRIAQEGVTNARRHARGASLVEVGLVVSPESVRLRVADDGAPGGAAPPPGYGLTGMAERADALGGWLRAGPTATGWLVEAELPRRAGP